MLSSINTKEEKKKERNKTAFMAYCKQTNNRNTEREDLKTS